MTSTSKKKREEVIRLSKDIYNEAYAMIDQGICCDEIGQVDGAIQMYEKGLKLIDMANELPKGDRGETYEKMNTAKKHIISRIADLRGEATGGSHLQPIDDINSVLSCLGNTKSAEELFCIPDGVQIFFLKGDDASVPSYPTSLKVLKFVTKDSNGFGSKNVATGQGQSIDSEPPAFLQVGDWVYPLVPNRSPVLHSTYDAYIFPNPSVDSLDSYVGVILPKDCDPELTRQFEALLIRYAAYKSEKSSPQLTKQEKERLSSRIATFLLNSTDFVVYNLKSGSDKASDVIRNQSTKLKSSTTNPKNVTIDPRVQTSIHYLRSGAKVAVKVSGYLVDKIGVLGAAIGRRVAVSVDQRLQASGKGSGARLAQDVIEVTSAGVVGVSTMFVALEEVSKKLAKCLASETVTVMEHKYGTDAATVTDKALYTAGFAAQTAWHIECLGFNSMAKRSAKAASLAFLKDLSRGGGEEERKIDDHTLINVSDDSKKATT